MNKLYFLRVPPRPRHSCPGPSFGSKIKRKKSARFLDDFPRLSLTTCRPLLVFSQTIPIAIVCGFLTCPVLFLLVFTDELPPLFRLSPRTPFQFLSPFLYQGPCRPVDSPVNSAPKNSPPPSDNLSSLFVLPLRIFLHPGVSLLTLTSFPMAPYRTQMGASPSPPFDISISRIGLSSVCCPASPSFLPMSSPPVVFFCC